MTHSTVNIALHTEQTTEFWRIKRDGRTLAVLDRAWDERRWFLLLPDGDGELRCCGAWARTATLKTCLRIWARR
jgi:hypothetical protein